MVTITSPIGRSTQDGFIVINWKAAGRVVAVLFVVALSIAIAIGREQLEQMAVYGYPAVFLVSLLGNVTLVLPAPSFAIVLLTAGVLNPVWIGLVAGLGAALGEMTGYLAGLSGQGIVEQRPIFRRIQRWMNKSGLLVIFGLAAVPNPVFDMGGIIAGMLRMPAWKFFLACWFGKSLRFGLLAFSAVALAS